MKLVQIIAIHIVVIATVTLPAAQDPLSEKPSEDSLIRKLQPPKQPIYEQYANSFPVHRAKRCGGGGCGGGCGGCGHPAPAPSKSYTVHITVQKKAAPVHRPPPRMVHRPVAVAVVPVAVVPVMARPAPVCCGGGGGGRGGGGGGKKWGKGK